MIVKRFFTTVLLLFAALVAAASLELYANQGQIMKGFFESLLSDQPIKPLTLSTLRRNKRPPSYLAADADQTSARTSTGALRLMAEPQAVEAAVRDLALNSLGAKERSDGGNLLFIDRTPTLRFPDGLHVWIDAVDDHARVAMFSRSFYARRVDFGVNQRRVMYMMQELSKRFPSDSSAD